MFNNIGGKIKTLAKVLCIIGIVLSIIWGLITMSTSAIALSRGNDSEFVIVLAAFLSGIFVAAIGSLLSWIGSFCLYGFGELIDKATEIAENTANSSYVANNIDKKAAPLHSMKAERQFDDEKFTKALDEFYREDTEEDA